LQFGLNLPIAEFSIFRCNRSFQPQSFFSRSPPSYLSKWQPISKDALRAKAGLRTRRGSGGAVVAGQAVSVKRTAPNRDEAEPLTIGCLRARQTSRCTSRPFIKITATCPASVRTLLSTSSFLFSTFPLFLSTIFSPKRPSTPSLVQFRVLRPCSALSLASLLALLSLSLCQLCEFLLTLSKQKRPVARSLHSNPRPSCICTLPTRITSVPVTFTLLSPRLSLSLSLSLYSLLTLTFSLSLRCLLVQSLSLVVNHIDI
jgi:hypothetical protein